MYCAGYSMPLHMCPELDLIELWVKLNQAQYFHALNFYRLDAPAAFKTAARSDTSPWQNMLICFVA